MSMVGVRERYSAHVGARVRERKCERVCVCFWTPWYLVRGPSLKKMVAAVFYLFSLSYTHIHTYATHVPKIGRLVRGPRLKEDGGSSVLGMYPEVDAADW